MLYNHGDSSYKQKFNSLFVFGYFFKPHTRVLLWTGHLFPIILLINQSWSIIFSPLDLLWKMSQLLILVIDSVSFVSLQVNYIEQVPIPIYPRKLLLLKRCFETNWSLEILSWFCLLFFSTEKTDCVESLC